jgi:hypothetical protein
MNRISHVVIVTVVGALLLLFGLPETPAVATSAKLSARLLTISQMPIGWSVVPSSGGGGIGCLKTVLEPKGVKQTATAQSDFQNSGGSLEVLEKLATFYDATTAYKKIVTTLKGCKAVSGTSSGKKVTGTVGAMSFPNYGSASAAFTVTFTIQGSAAFEDFLVVREGSVVMGLSEGGSSPINVSQFQGFVSKAMKRLTGGKSSSPVKTTTTTTKPKPNPNTSSTISFKDVNGTPYNVTLTVLYDPIDGANQYTTPNAGFRFVAADFRIRDTGSKQISDDANLNATVIGQNGQTYTADFDSMSGCTNFSSGQYQLNPGEFETGCVAFQVPVGVRVVKVKWSSDAGFGNFGEWTIT